MRRDVSDSLVRSAVLNFAGGRDAVVVSVWVLMLVGIGVGFAAVVVVTGTIWPPVVIRTVLFFARALQFGADDSAAPGLGPLVGSLAFGALAATYGIWLLHRHLHRHDGHSGEDSRSQHPRTIPSGP